MPTALLAPPHEAAIDERVFLRGVPWRQYLAVDRLRGESAVPRLTYLDGELELMTPSDYHEITKKKLARLVEAYADWAGLPLEGFGSWTLRSKPKKAGLEPDECYSLAPVPGERRLPQLAIEVVWTSGGLDKLAAYHRLGVAEVWFWRDERLSIHLRTADGYREERRSRLFPDLDPGILAAAMAEPTQTSAVATLRRRLGRR